MTPHTIDRAGSALVLVDYQARLLPAIHRGVQAVAHAARLADIARLLGVPVVGTEQNPEGLGANDDAVRSRCGETLAKTHFDACADGLVEHLHALRGGGGDGTRIGASPGDVDGARIGCSPDPARDGGVRDVVVAGCEAHVCLLQTALGLLRAGFRVWVVAEACGSRSPDDHALAMRRLERAGATIVSVEMVAFEWLHSCRHGRFREVLGVVKERLAD